MQVIPFLLFVIVGTFTPGPNVVMSIESARRNGMRATLPFVAGMSAGFAVIMFLAALFNIYLTSIMPTLRPLLGTVGMLYMLWLAAKQFMPSKPRLENKPVSGSAPFFKGLAIQFINPKVILYGLAIMSSFILPHYDSVPTIAAFSAGLGSLCMVSLTSWGFLGSLFEKTLVSSNRKLMNAIMAMLLVYCAYSVSGIKF